MILSILGRLFAAFLIYGLILYMYEHTRAFFERHYEFFEGVWLLIKRLVRK